MTLHPVASFALTVPPRLPAKAGPTISPDISFVDNVLALRPALQAFAYRLSAQRCDAEDLVQDTLVRALAAHHRFTEGTNLKAWLFTIMRNGFNTRWRHSKREVIIGSDVIELTVVTPATQEGVLWAREAASHLVCDLSPAHREILLLVPVQGLSYEDAAQICGCSVGTVKSRLNRARAALAVLSGGTSLRAS